MSLPREYPDDRGGEESNPDRTDGGIAGPRPAGGPQSAGQCEDEDARQRAAVSRRKRRRYHISDVLRVADFLFGEQLEAALAVLDDGGSAVGGGSAGVRAVRASPSGRSAVLVRGSSGGGSYVCLLGGGTGGGTGGRRNPRPSRRCRGHHCSCRSFFEKSKSDRWAVCKHLIAAILAPYLGDDYCREEVVRDAEFAGVVVGRSLP